MRLVDPRRWVVTCDPGIDDAVALAVAAGRGDCDLRAVVAGAGNVDALTAWRNACGLADLLGFDVPVAIGSAATVDGRPIRREGHAHGVDGLAGLARRLPHPGGGPPGARWAAPAGARNAPTDGGSLVGGDVVATGPLTDVALALRAGRPVGRVVWMGGSYVPAADGPGPVGHEFNAGVDPQAVDEVLVAAVDLAIVPIEVTRRVTLGPHDLARWSSGPPPARFCADLAVRRPRRGGHRIELHDPVAVVAALEPELFRWERRRVRCVAGGGDAPPGALVAAAGPPSAAIAVGVDAPAVRDRIVDAVLAAGRGEHG
jgi:inosine-uridine nucleoside N-ribohydrolase